MIWWKVCHRYIHWRTMKIVVVYVYFYINFTLLLSQKTKLQHMHEGKLLWNWPCDIICVAVCLKYSEMLNTECWSRMHWCYTCESSQVCFWCLQLQWCSLQWCSIAVRLPVPVPVLIPSVITSRPTTANRPSNPLNPFLLVPQIRFSLTIVCVLKLYFYLFVSVYMFVLN